MADREAKWATFQADTGWHEVRAKTEASGPIVDHVLNTFMRLTPYSPQPQIRSNIQELRIYDAMPGKLPALHDRFAKHTIGLFQKHGIENIAYWVDDVGTSNRLTYLLGYADLGAREKSWTAFRGRSCLAAGPRRFRKRRAAGASQPPRYPAPHPVFAALGSFGRRVASWRDGQMVVSPRGALLMSPMPDPFVYRPGVRLLKLYGVRCLETWIKDASSAPCG